MAGAYARLPHRSPLVCGTAVGTPVSRPAQDLQRRDLALRPQPDDDGHMTSSSASRSGAVSDRRPRDVRIWRRAMGAKTPSDVPVYRADLYSKAAIRDPYPHYAT